jgi:hypothetical protein
MTAKPAATCVDLPESPAEPREEAAPASETPDAQNSGHVPSGALWAPPGASPEELARRQRVVTAMGKAKPRAKWGAR